MGVGVRDSRGGMTGEDSVVVLLCFYFFFFFFFFLFGSFWHAWGWAVECSLHFYFLGLGLFSNLVLGFLSAEWASVWLF